MVLDTGTCSEVRDPMKYWHMPLNEALADRWADGIAKYRQHLAQEFQGDPVEEAFEEALDLCNYSDEAVENGPENERAQMRRISQCAENLANAVRDILREREGLR